MASISPPKVTVVQLGARQRYAVPLILEQAGLLYRLITDAYAGPGSVLHRFRFLLRGLGEVPPLKSLFERFADIAPARIDAHNVLGTRHMMQRVLARDIRSLSRAHLNAGEALGRSVSETDIEQSDIVYAYCWGARSLFERCLSSGKTTVLDQMCAAVRVEDAIMRQEQEIWGDLVPLRPEDDLLAASEYEHLEHQLASIILVPSQFVLNTLEQSGVPTSKMRVVPYGIPVNEANPHIRRLDRGRPLRLLYVGGVRPQKGVHYLLEAARKWDRRRIQLRLVGSIAFPDSYMQKNREGVEYIGGVPYSEVQAHYDWADVFVFPSLCEGMARVICEAMHNGLPVIATPNSGASDIVMDEEHGYIVPIRDSDALAERVERFLVDKDRLPFMSEKALAKSKFLTLEAYGQRLVRSLKELA